MLAAPPFWLEVWNIEVLAEYSAKDFDDSLFRDFQKEGNCMCLVMCYERLSEYVRNREEVCSGMYCIEN